MPLVPVLSDAQKRDHIRLFREQACNSEGRLPSRIFNDVSSKLKYMASG